MNNGSKIIGDEACPKCREKGRDSTGNHLIIFDDGGKYCNRCGYKEFDKGSGEDDEWVVPDETVEMIDHLPSHANKDRRINEEVMKHYGVKCSYSESNGSLAAVYYPITKSGSLIAYHKRSLPKRFSIISELSLKGELVDFFGQSVCSGGKKLLITEGQEDALAAYQMLKDKYPSFSPDVVSLPNGANVSIIQSQEEFLSGYEEILICADGDKEGVKVQSKLAKLIGQRARVVKIPEKDASDMRTKAKDSLFLSSYFNAKPFSPKEIIRISDIKDEIMQDIEYGLSYPWESLTEISYGLFTKQIISIGASVGAGKTVVVNQIVSHIIHEHKQHVALFSLEDTPVSAAKRLISFVSGERVDLPGVEIDKDKVQEAAKSLEEYLTIYDAQGYLSWDDISSNMRYLASTGTKFFIIDPLTAITASLSSSAANELLNEMLADLAKMILSLDVTVFLVSHLNNSSGKAHSEGGRVTMDQFSNSRAVVRWSHLSLGLERDQQAEEEDEKNVMTIRVLKNRMAGTLSSFQLKYNKDNGRLEEESYEF